MTICNFWQQGTCRFGENCRYEHPRGFGGGGFAGGSGGQDITNTLVQTVKQDIEQWEKGKQWVFSCYSPAKECSSIPGIEDLSPEELRLEAYQAKTNGTAPQFQQKMTELVKSYAEKRQALLNPNNDVKDLLRRIYNKENVSMGNRNVFGGAAQSNSVFGGSLAQNTPSTSSIFGGKPTFGSPPSGSSMFGAQSSGQNIFGKTAAPATGSIFGGKPAFGAASSGSIFGGQTAATGQTSSLFGSAPTTQSSIFGAAKSSVFGAAPAFGAAPTSTASAFGSTPASSASVFGSPQQQPQSVFGSPAQQQPQSSVFGAPQPQQSIFGSPATQQPQQQQSVFGSSVFGTSPQQPQQSAFGAPTPAPAFGSQTVPQTSTQQPFGGSAFGQSAPATGASLFGTSTSAQPAAFGAQKTGESLFGSSAAQPSGGLFGRSENVGLFGQVIQPVNDPSRHTPSDQLTPEEVAAFKADEFALGCVPIRPPPKELCA